MTAAVPLTEDLVYRIAPDGNSTKAAADLVKRGAFRNPRRAPDGAWLDAGCQGSESQPYVVLVDLSDPAAVVSACNCGSMKRPCKHALGLLLLAVRAPESFEEAAPPETLRKRLAKDPWSAPVRPALSDQKAPSSEGEALLQAIFANPLDDVPRLIYADWLEEHGTAPEDKARADFIRVQCERARLGEKASPKLRQREQQVWDKHRQLWLTHVPRHLRGTCGTFERGFLGEVHLSPQALLKYGPVLFEHHPIHHVILSEPKQPNGPKLAVCPFLAQIRSLSCPNNDIEPQLLRMLLESPLLSNLTALRWWPRALTAAQMRSLAPLPVFARLESLNLKGSLDDSGVRALLRAPDLGRLRVLDLSGNPIGNAGAAALAGATNLGGLRELHLSNTEVGPAGVKALLASPLAAQLTVLALVNAHITETPALALAASPSLDKLTRLDLRGAPVGKAAAALKERFGERVQL